MKDYDEFQINLTLKFKIPKEEITINSVLYTVSQCSKEVDKAIAKALLAGIEEKAIAEKLKAEPGYALNGHQSTERQIKASFGSFGYRCAQLYDRLNGKTIIPLQEKLKWPSYCRYMNEAVASCSSLVTDVSFRKAVKEASRMTGTEVSATTFHRMFQIFAEGYCQWPEQKDIPYRFLMGDGTPIRIQDGRGRSLGKKEMRWAMGSTGEGQPFSLLGFWLDTEWSKIKNELKGIINYSKIEVLFADGGKEIQALLEDGMDLQRCVLHGEKELFFKLYLDGFKKKKQEPFKKLMAALPVFQLNKARLEKLSPQDKEAVEKMANQSRQGLEEIIKILNPDKYPKARSYLLNLKEDLFTFFDVWLKTGEWIPLTTNALESGFSQVKNRLWSIGKRWTEKGVLNWLKISLLKIFKPQLWEELWGKYLKINPAFQLVSLEVAWQWS